MAPNLMEMRSTPFCGMFTSMTIEYSKETLTSYGIKVDNERMGVLHSATSALVFRNAYTEGWMICRVAIEDLWNISLWVVKIRAETYTIGIQVCCCDGFGACIWGVGEHDCDGHSRSSFGVVRPSLLLSYNSVCLSNPPLQSLRSRASE